MRESITMEYERLSLKSIMESPPGEFIHQVVDKYGLQAIFRLTTAPRIHYRPISPNNCTAKALSSRNINLDLGLSQSPSVLKPANNDERSTAPTPTVFALTGMQERRLRREGVLRDSSSPIQPETAALLQLMRPIIVKGGTRHSIIANGDPILVANQQRCTSPTLSSTTTTSHSSSPDMTLTPSGLADDISSPPPLSFSTAQYTAPFCSSSDSSPPGINDLAAVEALLTLSTRIVMTSSQRHPFSDYYTDEEAESRARQQLSLAASDKPFDVNRLTHAAADEAVVNAWLEDTASYPAGYLPMPPKPGAPCSAMSQDSDSEHTHPASAALACSKAAEGTVCWTSHARAAQLLLSAAATATANAMEGAGGGGWGGVDTATRGAYKCRYCGKPKKGHMCSLSPSARPLASSSDYSRAAVGSKEDNAVTFEMPGGETRDGSCAMNGGGDGRSCMQLQGNVSDAVHRAHRNASGLSTLSGGGLAQAPGGRGEEDSSYSKKDGGGGVGSVGGEVDDASMLCARVLAARQTRISNGGTAATAGHCQQQQPPADNEHDGAIRSVKGKGKRGAREAGSGRNRCNAHGPKGSGGSSDTLDASPPPSQSVTPPNLVCTHVAYVDVTQDKERRHAPESSGMMGTPDSSERMHAGLESHMGSAATAHAYTHAPSPSLGGHAIVSRKRGSDLLPADQSRWAKSRKSSAHMRTHAHTRMPVHPPLVSSIGVINSSQMDLFLAGLSSASCIKKADAARERK